MNLTFFNLQGFKELKLEKEQLKEIFFIYGVCISRVATMDDFFITKLKFNKYEFEGRLIGETFTQEQINKIEAHYFNKATMGMVINEFREKFTTDDFEDLFTELLRVRNLIVHSYMKLNWPQLQTERLRIEIYDDLLGVFNFLNRFEEEVKNKTFFTRKNSAFGIRWTGKV
jgi:uncharacterized protein with HEPN domain